MSFPLPAAATSVAPATNGRGPHRSDPPARDPLEETVARLLELLGEDPGREGLARTPERVARALRTLTGGYPRTARDVIGDGLFEESYEGIVLVRDVEFHSLCEHHLLPFHGTAHVAYLPAGRVVGLSKIARVVELFARRLQVQERLTDQIADALHDVLEPRGVAVAVEAEHMCMTMRGVEQRHARTFTRSYRGRFRDDLGLQEEFLGQIRTR
ncbi:MAG TPA: GTP cyclohydrolase I FolE [Longimicrobiales bacterium]|nr:GTP cyclohydrolase I FolE [Longimicrobiales bacterium]